MCLAFSKKTPPIFDPQIFEKQPHIRVLRIVRVLFSASLSCKKHPGTMRTRTREGDFKTSRFLPFGRVARRGPKKLAIFLDFFKFLNFFDKILKFLKNNFFGN